VIKAQEFDRVVEKLGFKTRDGKDLLAWLEYGGRVVVRTRRSKGSGDLPFHHSIRQQMKLDAEQLREAIACSLGRQEYIEILRTKGLLGG
jgi:hypothetical protein